MAANGSRAGNPYDPGTLEHDFFDAYGRAPSATDYVAMSIPGGIGRVQAQAEQIRTQNAGAQAAGIPGAPPQARPPGEMGPPVPPGLQRQMQEANWGDPNAGAASMAGGPFGQLANTLRNSMSGNDTGGPVGAGYGGAGDAGAGGGDWTGAYEAGAASRARIAGEGAMPDAGSAPPPPADTTSPYAPGGGGQTPEQGMSTFPGGGGGYGRQGGGVPPRYLGGAPVTGNLGYGPSAQLAQQYGNNYQNALARNQQLYGGIMRGYNTAQQRQVAGQRGVLQGYGQLGGQLSQGYGQLSQGIGAGYGQLQNQSGQGYGQLSQGVGSGYGAVNQSVQGYLNPMDTALQQQQAQNAQTQQGYWGLNNNVMSTLQGIDASQRQAISDAYARQAGSTNSSLIARGLGNATVRDSLQRGNLLDKQKADIALSNSTAQLTAGYQSQLGLAALGFAGQANQQNTAQQNAIASARAGYGAQTGMANVAAQQNIGMNAIQAQQNLGQNNIAAQQGIGQAGLASRQNLGQNALNFGQQAIGANTNLTENQLGFLNSIQAPYPSAAPYQQLQQQAGALRQFNYNPGGR